MLAVVIPGTTEGAVSRWRAQRDRNVLPRQRAAGGLEEGVLEARELYSLPVLICGVAAIIFAAWLARDVLSRDSGTPAMQDIANRIYIGAVAFLRRQYSTIAILAVFVAIIIGFVVGFFEREYQTTRGIITALAFLFGALLSGISGYTGMYIAVRSNSRTASAARRSLGEALTVSLRGGAVSGFLVVALGLLGVLIMYWVVYPLVQSTLPAEAETPFWIVGFAFGASFVALFAQLGGGIYTKAADVGADLVGKVEAGIPEDDPRNPAVIADLVGDNVGDCAGRGADIFESSVGRNHRRHDPGRDTLHRVDGTRESAVPRLRLLPARSRCAFGAHLPRWSASSQCARRRLPRTPWTS